MTPGRECGQKLSQEVISERAVLYVLGELEDAENIAFENHLQECPACQSEVRRFGDVAVDLMDGLPPVSPPEHLRDRVLTIPRLPAGVAALVRANEGTWEPTPFEGVTVKRLFADPTSGMLCSLVRLKRDAVYPPHRHAQTEHCFVLEGDLVFRDHTLFAGDYEAAIADSDHSVVTTKTGCLVMIVHNEGDFVYPMQKLAD